MGLTPQRVVVGGLPGLAWRSGGGDKPRLLFWHGGYSTHTVFERFAPAFVAAGFDCFALSRRGRTGIPPADANGVTFDDYVEDTVAALQALGCSVSIIGHSLGGLLALKAAERQPCRAVVLLAPVPPREVGVRPSLRVAATYARHVPQILSGRPYQPSFSTAVALWLGAVPNANRRRVYAKLVPESGRVTRTVFTGVSVPPEKIQVPLLAIAGVRDPVIPVQAVQRLANVYHGDFWARREGGHWPMDESGSDDLGRAISEWLETRSRLAAVP